MSKLSYLHLVCRLLNKERSRCGSNCLTYFHSPKSFGMQCLGNEYSARDSSTVSSDPLCKTKVSRSLEGRRALIEDAIRGNILREWVNS